MNIEWLDGWDACNREWLFRIEQKIIELETGTGFAVNNIGIAEIFRKFITDANITEAAKAKDTV